MSDRNYGWHPTRPLLWHGDTVYEWHPGSRYLEPVKAIEHERETWTAQHYDRWSCVTEGGGLIVLDAEDRATVAREMARAAMDHAYPVGSKIFLRTDNGYYTGRLIRVTARELVLEDAAWLAGYVRHTARLETAEVKSVEPWPDPVIFSRDAVLDCTLWRHELPRNVV